MDDRVRVNDYGGEQASACCTNSGSSASEGAATHSWRYEEIWTIEDEQCQRIGGEHKAMKFRFLLFL
jgi:hypothetical protein